MATGTRTARSALLAPKKWRGTRIWIFWMIICLQSSSLGEHGTDKMMKRILTPLLLVLCILARSAAQEPLHTARGTVEKTGKESVILRIPEAGDTSARIIELTLNKHSKLLSAPSRDEQATEEIAPISISWDQLRPKQFLAVIYSPTSNVILAAVVQATQGRRETGNVKLPDGVPAKVAAVLKHIDETGKPLKDYEGGRTFLNLGKNGEESLPRRDSRGKAISYHEWDVNPHIPGRNRGTERLITGSDGSAYYTADHYKTYTKIR
jgi:guanyl-specific ribonuclease Sa